MGYDVWLAADVGGDEPISLDLLSANYTYNVGKMFFHAVGEGPNQWDRRSAADVAAVCVRMLEAFAADPDTYRAMNPPNGWGNFEGAAGFIWEIGCACMRAPKAVVRVC